MHHYIHIMMAMTSFFLLLSLTSLASPFPAPPNQPPQVITSPHGAVAADDARCSAAGRDALLHGGSAVDAAVTVALCLGVVSPASSGLGGGAFMLLHLQSTGDAWAFDMRETAPLSSSQHMFENNTASKSSGPLSIAVPGELAGLYKAWKSYGKLPWPQLVAPAINLAQNGFQVSRYLRVQMESAINGILSDEGLRQVFTINGTLLKVGDICYNKRLAKTLTNIAKQGPSVFYSGSVGAQLVADVKKGGGILSMEDLRRYKVKVTRPLSADVIGLKFLGMPPPSAGGAGLILVLNILSQYGIPAGVTGPLGVHRLIESLKHFFAIRPNLGDPDFINDSKVLSDMLSPKFAAKLKKTIHDNTTFGPAYYGDK